MENRWGVPLALCVSTWALAVVVSARGDDTSLLRDAFLRDYPRALKAWEAHASRAKGVVRRTVERHISKDVKRITSVTLEFECKRPDMARVVSEGEGSATKGDATKKLARSWRVLSQNHDYSFELRKRDANGKFSVVSFENNSDDKSSVEGGVMGLSLFRYLEAPVSLHVFRLSGLLAAKGFSVRAVSRVPAAGKQMLRADFELKPNAKGEVGLEGWFTVSPDEAWAVNEYEYVDRSKNSVHGAIEYGGMQGGFPVPMRFVLTMKQNPETGVSSVSTTYDFDKIEFVEVPDRDFTLAAFGMPELGRPTARPYVMSPAAWFLTVSVLALAMAVVLNVASSRFQKKEQRSGV